MNVPPMLSAEVNAHPSQPDIQADQAFESPTSKLPVPPQIRTQEDPVAHPLSKFPEGQVPAPGHLLKRPTPKQALGKAIRAQVTRNDHRQGPKNP